MRGNRSEKVQAMVFDFDGTLAELRLDFAEMKRRLSGLAESYLSRALPEPVVPALEWSEMLRALIEESDTDCAEEFRYRANELVVRMELESAHRGCLFPFTRPILRLLGRRGIRTAIITRNCEAAVRVVFNDMDEFCTTFLARDHVPRVKPDPDHLFRALKKTKANPAGALIVGDHPLDVQTGKRAGILTAGVWSGSASSADLMKSGADWVARNCEELMRVLSEQKLI
jgi:phosphoglycolate phosphatase